MRIAEQFDELLRSDVDEIVHRARDYDTQTRFQLLRAAAERYEDLHQSIERLKAVWLVQSILASLDDRQLPFATSAQIGARLASIVESNQSERDARRRALDSLALLFLKAQQLTEPLGATIRDAFTSVMRSNDSYLSEFAAEALSDRGVLARRGAVAAESAEARLAREA